MTVASSHIGDLLHELETIYRDADVPMAAWSCDASTACCRFGVTGREPYVTSIELALLDRAIAARGGPLPPRRQALPLSQETRSAVGSRRVGSQGERICPLLDSQGRCAVYAARPLGCRTFFCERATSPGRMPREEIRRLVDRIEELAARHRAEGDRGRPLGRFLGV